MQVRSFAALALVLGMPLAAACGGGGKPATSPSPQAAPGGAKPPAVGAPTTAER